MPSWHPEDQGAGREGRAMMASLRTPTEGNLDLKNPKGDWVVPTPFRRGRWRSRFARPSYDIPCARNLTWSQGSNGQCHTPNSCVRLEPPTPYPCPGIGLCSTVFSETRKQEGYGITPMEGIWTLPPLCPWPLHETEHQAPHEWRLPLVQEGGLH